MQRHTILDSEGQLEHLEALIHSLYLLLRLPLRLYQNDTLIYDPRQEQRKASLGQGPLDGLKSSAARQAATDNLAVRLSQISPRVEGIMAVKDISNYRYMYLPLAYNYTVILGPFLYRDDTVSVADLLRQGIFELAESEIASEILAAIPRLTEASAKTIAHYVTDFCQHFIPKSSATASSACRKVDKAPASQEELDATYLRERKSCSLSTPLPPDYYRSHLNNRSQSFAHANVYLEEEMLAAMSEGDEELALQLLHRINSKERANLALSPLRSLKNSLIASVTLFARAAIKGGVSYSNSFTLSDAYIRKIEDIQEISSLEKLEESALKDYVSLVRQARDEHSRRSPNVLKIMRYINMHLVEDLNLKNLAAEFHLHPAYLSKLFKAEVGEGLSKYIRRKRLEEAAKMIKYTSNSLQDIANFYGFSSQSHFTRDFKQLYGQTPGKWRQANMV